VGPSGAGKSTIAALIPRLWDVPEGRITVGGVNIKDIPLNALMNEIAFVFQDTFVFGDTVHENLCMGKEVSRGRVIAAARAAQLHDVIARLPRGYDTMLGEGGAHLSSGEKQRLAIARAIVKDAPIVVLDEPTSFADPENEVRIKEAFSKLMRGKTVIVIAHNLSTVTDADSIVVIEDGRIAGTGRHEELLTSQPLYQRMWQLHVAARTWTI
jgi:ATP-binding cassette, subfamily B, bacterial IrtA/YbtP